ncbi:MAG: hypothetical protein JWN41_150 [Thermoleophilia bacterium]|nr:hypothetical protein [Thermoleophilia bacterium]
MAAWLRKERIQVSVPTTLQGVHDGCGGVVVFRPAEHRDALLVGDTVELSATCQTCSNSLTMAWALPHAGELRAQRAAASNDTVPATAGRPSPGFRTALPERGTTRTAHTPEPLPAPSAPESVPVDAVVSEFLSRFSDRIDQARANLGRVSEELPSVIVTDLRRPKLSRAAPVETHVLSATPRGFATQASPIAPAVAPPPPALAERTSVALAPRTPQSHAFAAPAPAPEPPAAPSVATPAPQTPAGPMALPRPRSMTRQAVASTDIDIFPPTAPTTVRAPREAATVVAGGPRTAEAPDARAGWAPPSPTSARLPMAPPKIPPPVAPESTAVFAPSSVPPRPATATAAPQSTTPPPVALPTQSDDLAGADSSAGAASIAETAPTAEFAEPDRGFDWGERDKAPRRDGRAKRIRASRTTHEDALSLPAVSSFADGDGADGAITRTGTRIGPALVFAMVVLAAIAGLAAVKIVSTPKAPPTAASSSTPAAAPLAGARKPTPAQAAALARTKAAKAAKAAKAKAQAAAARRASATGTPVAVHVPATGADTAPVTAATPTSSSPTAST